MLEVIASNTKEAEEKKILGTAKEIELDACISVIARQGRGRAALTEAFTGAGTNWRSPICPQEITEIRL
jgi:hypothetical protein